MNIQNKQKKIKIAEILGNCKTGGVISCVMNFFRCIDKTKFQLDFYMNTTSPYDDEIKSLGGNIFYYKKFTNPIKAISTLKNNFKNNDYDIVHSHLTTLSAFSLYAAKKANLPIRICHSHSTSNKKEHARYIAKEILKPFAIKYATSLCACSNLSASWMFKEKAKDAFILHNAINLNKFNKSNINILKDKEALSIQNKKVIGFVGRFSKQKNISFLIDIFKNLTSLRNDAVLLLIGNGKDEKKIKKQIDKYHLKDKVLILSNTQDIEKYYAIMDIFILPSLYEGLPLVAVESQAMNIPTLLSTNITTETKLTPLVEFLPIDTPTIWANKINEILKNNNTAKISLKGTDYDIETEVKKLEDFYSSLIGEKC